MTQPVKLETVQVGPVKPFVQMQEQAVLSIIDVPPFWQAVAVFVEQAWRAVVAVVDDEDFGLWNTRSSSGTTTAAAIMIRSIKRTRTKPQHGRPQQRRRFLGCLLRELGSLGPFESSDGDGHDDIGRVGVPPRVGVPKPGGGNADSIPERPD